MSVAAGVVQSPSATAPMVCLICAKSASNQLVSVRSSMPATVTLDATGKPIAHVPQPYRQQPVDCKHVFVTEEEFLNGANSRLAERLAEAKALAAEDRARRAAKGSRRFGSDAMDRMELAFLNVDCSRWTMSNPPRMTTLKYNGSGRRRSSSETVWIEFAESYEEVAAHLKQLAAIMELAYGVPFDAMRVLEFARKGFNPHFHILHTVPLDAFGNDARAQFKDKSLYSDWSGLEFWELLECAWALITNQAFDLSSPNRKGKITWMPQANQVKKADSIRDYIERFIDYSRKSGKNSHKLTQHTVAYQWDKQQVNFWGIIGFKGARRAKHAPLVLECRTEEATRAALEYMRKIDRVQPRVLSLEDKDVDGNVIGTVEIDCSRLSTERNRLQGGRTRTRPDAKQLTVLRRLIAFYNTVGTETTETVPEASKGPSSDAQEPYSDLVDGYSEPIVRDAKFILAIFELPPAPWEKDAKIFLSHLIEDAATHC